MKITSWLLPVFIDLNFNLLLFAFALTSFVYLQLRMYPAILDCYTTVYKPEIYHNDKNPLD